jgi:hypothetical protein
MPGRTIAGRTQMLIFSAAAAAAAAANKSIESNPDAESRSNPLHLTRAPSGGSPAPLSHVDEWSSARSQRQANPTGATSSKQDRLPVGQERTFSILQLPMHGPTCVCLRSSGQRATGMSMRKSLVRQSRCGRGLTRRCKELPV